MNLQIINCTNEPKSELYKNIKEIQDLYKPITIFDLLPIKDMGPNRYPFDYFYIFRININIPKKDDNLYDVDFNIKNPLNEALQDFLNTYEERSKLYTIEKFLEWNKEVHHKYRYELFETIHHYKRLTTHLKGFTLVDNGKLISLFL